MEPQETTDFGTGANVLPSYRQHLPVFLEPDYATGEPIDVELDCE